MDPFQAKLTAAATGSTLTALTMTPFDVVKTRIQTQRPQPSPSKAPLFTKPPNNGCCQPTGQPCVRQMSTFARTLAQEEYVCVFERGVARTEPVRGFYDATRHVWRAEGLRGLWKGSATTLVIGVPSSTAYMLTYDHLLHHILPSVLPPAMVPMIAGIAARTTISTIASPLELIRTNLQSTPLHPDRPNTLRSVLISVRATVRAQGILSLWRGVGPTLWRDVPFSGFYWASYETLKGFFARHGRAGADTAFLSGAISGTAGALLTSPFDVLKTRREAMIMSSGETGSQSSLAVLSRIARTEGMSALFAGVVPRIVKIAPACGIMIASFEGVGRFLAKPTVASD